ncbi:MAG: 50S ribosomal protein L24 [uncultured bacterium]|nr:MAG: 50S ribosomal protein L24 [uncultured bacterium]OGT37162.1 MAG: 50S ribosomal protein L24 [Gammaproteobacteria bacterium RIFCSPHIGHO2_12_FULL_38_14]
MKKIKNNDNVVVLTGRDKGRSGKVIKILDDLYVLVEGVNIVKKNIKPNPNKNTKGGIVDRESPIHISNIALLNPLTKKADKVGFKFLESNSLEAKSKKVRYFKSNKEIVDTE